MWRRRRCTYLLTDGSRRRRCGQGGRCPRLRGDEGHDPCDPPSHDGPHSHSHHSFWQSARAHSPQTVCLAALARRLCSDRRTSAGTLRRESKSPPFHCALEENGILLLPTRMMICSHGVDAHSRVRAMRRRWRGALRGRQPTQPPPPPAAAARPFSRPHLRQQRAPSDGRRQR